MSSLVLDLQRSAMEPATPVVSLVRAALAVASKLDHTDLRAWAQHELSGYPDINVPSYRRIEGELKAHNPYRGLIPVHIGDPATARHLATKAIVQPIAELENINAQGDRGGTIAIPFSQEVLNRFFVNTEEYRLGIVPFVLIGWAQVHGILESVRTAVLEWTLQLEKQGVLGEGFVFSATEVTKASQITYNIEHFTGVLGNVSRSSIHIGDYNSIHAALKALGVPQEGRNELEAILDEAEAAPVEKKKALATRAMEWLAKYGPVLGTLSDTLRGWFEQLHK